MTHELILTSVASGVRSPGQALKESGLYLVAADSGIPTQLVDPLSSLSLLQYRPFIAAADRRPAVLSHLILSDGQESGIRHHILSRTALCETDSVERDKPKPDGETNLAGKGRESALPNVIAHHIILNPQEYTSEGPGWLLGLSGFHMTCWDGLALQFSRGRPLPTLTNSPALTRRQQIARQFRWLDERGITLNRPVEQHAETYLSFVRDNEGQIALTAKPTSSCLAWAELTGDSGWGGVLAETALTGQSVILLHHPGQNILPLFVESLALLPPYAAWRTTFCTDYAGLSDLCDTLKIPCQWKGVLAGSDEADTLLNTVKNQELKDGDLETLVIDLTKPMKSVQPGAYIAFARYGQETMLPFKLEDALIGFSQQGVTTDGLYSSSQSFRGVSGLLPPKRPIRLVESLLRRASRSQFYFLYSIMFALVLFLLFLAMDQVGNFGIVQRLLHQDKTGGELPQIMQDRPEQDRLEQELPVDVDIAGESASVLDIAGPEITDTDLGVEVLPESAEYAEYLEQFTANRSLRRLPLLEKLKEFSVPDNLAFHFPEDGNFELLEDTVFDVWSPLYPFAEALELRYVPLFDLPYREISTQFRSDLLPDLVWQVYAVDSETDLRTEMFRFQWDPAGLMMSWQAEGLSNQHFYETMLSSLGFLEIQPWSEEQTQSAEENVVVTMHIPLFAPIQQEPVWLMDLEQDESYDIFLPFASELWQQVFAHFFSEDELQNIVMMEIHCSLSAASDDLLAVNSVMPLSQFETEIATTQQIDTQTEDGRSIFKHISIPLTATASLDKVVWKLEPVADRLLEDLERYRSEKTTLERTLTQLLEQGLGTSRIDQTARSSLQAELRQLDHQIDEIEKTLQRLPAAYGDLGRDTRRRFTGSIFLQSPDGKRRLLVMTLREHEP